MAEGDFSLINKSIYYWDCYLLTGKRDYLTAAYQFMQEYRKSGGDLYKETEQRMAETIKPMCWNCGVPSDTGLCSPCDFLLHWTDKYKVRPNGETEAFVNRRWQMRFNRGELPDERGDAGVLWEKKRHLQDW